MNFKKILIPLMMAGCIIAPCQVNESHAAEQTTSEMAMSIDKCVLLPGQTSTVQVYNHSGEKIQWFVNGVLQEGNESSSFTFSSQETGKYKILAMSNEKIIDVKELEVVPTEGNHILSYGYMADKVVGDDFNGYGSVNPLIGIAESTAFKLTNTDGNGYLESVASAWGGTPWWVTNVGSLNLVDNYEVSYDVLYPENVYGIGGFQIGSAVNGGAYEIGCFELASNGFSRLYANGPDGQLYNSDTIEMGGTSTKCAIKNGEWFNYRMVKIGNEFYFYINQDLIVQRRIDFNYTTLTGICFIQFLVDNTVGIRYDNLKVQGIELTSNTENPVGINKNLQGLSLNLSATKVEQGDAVAAKATLAPFDASIDKIDWYINDTYVESTTSLFYNIPCLELGTVKVQAKVGALSSEPQVVEVVANGSVRLVEYINGNYSSDLGLHFLIKKEDLAQYENYTVEIMKAIYTENRITSYETFVTENLGTRTVENQEYYVFGSNGIKFYEMTSQIVCNVTVTKAGCTFVADTYSLTFASYAKQMLEAYQNGTTDISYKKVQIIRQLLSLGGLSQEDHNYHLADLASNYDVNVTERA